MSDDSPRVTVALVSEQIRGLERLTNTGFESVQRQLDAVAGLPVAVATVSSKMAALEQRVTDLENDDGSAVEWRRSSFPLIVLAAIAIVVNIVLVAGSFH